MSIKEIAEAVGTSVSTVSRVLSNPDYKCSSKELHDRILSAAREMNYIPDEAAKSLRLGKSQKTGHYRISILVTRHDKHTDPFFSELIEAIRSEINQHMCIFANIWFEQSFSDEDEAEKMNIKKVVNDLYNDGKTDGLIIIGKCLPKIISELKSKWKNIVSVNRNSTNNEVDEVICDGAKIASKAVNHLIRLGHRKISYIGECRNESRFKGFQETMLMHNIEMNLDYIFQAKASENDGYSAMERIIKLSNRPTGIYCSNDIIAIGVLKALSKFSNRYYNPSVISSDDISEAKYTKPMLTTLSLPKKEMAKYAVYLLVDKLNYGHKSVTKIEVESTLVIRNSCNPLNNSDYIEYCI